MGKKNPTLVCFCQCSCGATEEVDVKMRDGIVYQVISPFYRRHRRLHHRLRLWDKAVPERFLLQSDQDIKQGQVIIRRG